LALAGSFGTILPLLLYFAGVWPMRLGVPFLTLPSLLLLMALAVRARGGEAPEFWTRYAAGFVGGLIGTAAYDGSRLIGLAWRFPGFAVIGKFGLLITGREDAGLLTLAVGWAYHVSNGGVFGIAYALVAGRAAIPWGIAWGLFLEAAMLVTYPAAFGVDMSWGTAALTFSLAGHVCYGAALAALVRRLIPDTSSMFREGAI
jgi:hypothetical protein